MTKTSALLLFVVAFLQRTSDVSAFVHSAGWAPVTTTTTTHNAVWRTTTGIGMSTAAETKSGASQSTDASTLTLFSPCKINLFLRILRKRADGYHDLSSLFQAVGFGDTLELTPIQGGAEKDEFTCNMPGVPVDSSNLVLRALQLMRQKTGCTDQFFQANLIKQCPAQAGLGGGSANAATAMWGANQLMGEPATVEQVWYTPHLLAFLFADAHPFAHFSFFILY
jgi:hypothetical protein